MRYWTLILNGNVLFYLQRLFRLVWLVAAWEARWRIISIVEESRVLLILSWFGRRYWLWAGASSLWNSRSDGDSRSKRCRLSELWHFSFSGDDETFTRCLISLKMWKLFKNSFEDSLTTKLNANEDWMFRKVLFQQFLEISIEVKIWKVHSQNNSQLCELIFYSFQF